VRDLPRALAARGHDNVVITPAYDALHRLPGSRQTGSLTVAFGGGETVAGIFEISGDGGRVRHIVIEHERLAAGGAGCIYTDDGPDRPFATDAGKFAFLCAAAAAWLLDNAGGDDVVHLHDWHAALVLALREFDPAFEALKSLPMVYTIHNLSLQGIRPIANDASSFAAWFPALIDWAPAIADPRYPDCVNPMAAGIRLADSVNTVSPTNAQEIVLQDDPARGFHGGAGLHEDLRAAQRDERLFGILNGCHYDGAAPVQNAWPAIHAAAQQLLPRWIGAEPTVSSAHYLADRKLRTMAAERPAILLISVGRLTPQKADLFLTRTPDGPIAIEAILEALDDDGLFILLGTGDAAIERALTAIAARKTRFLFLRGYSDALANLLYQEGDLFLMPSAFEPCGISQMLAMRAGQPCVVHGVGGLRDTVVDQETGFVFDGEGAAVQAGRFVDKVTEALELRVAKPGRWSAIRENAAAQRFDWSRAAAHYEADMYGISHD
jgi:starch synthase